MRPAAYYYILFLFISLFSSFSLAKDSMSGTLSVELLTYYHPEDTIHTGSKCDTSIIFIKKNYCDPKFTIHVYKSISGKYENDEVDKNLLFTQEVNNGLPFKDSTYIDFKNANILGNPVKKEIMEIPEEILVIITVNDNQGAIMDIFRVKVKSPGKYNMNPQFGHINKRISLNIAVSWQCNADFYGKRCEIFCQPQHNPNKGFYGCLAQSGTKVCEKGFIGSSCAQQDLCYPINPCQYSSTCVNNLSEGNMNNAIQQNNSYNCICPDHLIGTRCEMAKVPCTDTDSSTWCNGHGLCWQSDNNKHCSCHRNYYGNRCEQFVTDLIPPTINDYQCRNIHEIITKDKMCLNQGKCLSSSFTNVNDLCFCTHGFSGEFCDQSTKWVNEYQEIDLWNFYQQQWNSELAKNKIISTTTTIKATLDSIDKPSPPPPSSPDVACKLNDPRPQCLPMGMPAVPPSHYMDYPSMPWMIVICAFLIIIIVICLIMFIILRRKFKRVTQRTEDYLYTLTLQRRPEPEIPTVVYYPCLQPAAAAEDEYLDPLNNELSTIYEPLDD